MRRRNRCTQADLNDMARNSRHPKQAAEASKYLDLGWNCFRVETRDGATVVLLQHPDSGRNGHTFGVMLPNGRFIRNGIGRKTVNWSWADARAAADAPISATA